MKKKDFTIVYVDDEEQNLISFKASFRREYNILTALSGKEGIEILKNNDVHLIITDQRMPEMTGIQFLERIMPEFPDSIRIILTGFSDIEAIIGAINAGRVFRYITKPWDENELRMTIENTRQLYELQEDRKQILSDLQQKVEEQEKTLKLFMKYVPEQVVSKALESSEDTIFDGEQREIAVLFCDIRGFTPMSEKKSPKEVVSLLNDYYSLMSESIKRYKGTTIQYVGDEVFAAFGAPVSIADKEKMAVFCALDMMRSLSKLNEKYMNKFKKEIKIGIGINYGEVIAGNLGSEEILSYSVTGDTVNTGKRIESVTRDYPNSILISNSIYQKTKDIIDIKEFEPLQVKGKKEKILVYQVLRSK
jgi:adenylate cyclase